jgi:putative DNA primase/helicase
MTSVYEAALSIGVIADKLPYTPIIERWYRLPVVGKKPSNKAGAIKFHSLTMAVICNNVTGESFTWFANDTSDPVELSRRRLEAQAASLQAQENQRKAHEQAALEAKSIYNNATPASPQHPYLMRKGLEPAKLRQAGNALVAPVYSCIDGKIMSVQYIERDGFKHFMEGGKAKGGFYATRQAKTGEMLVLSEGVATSLSLQQHWKIDGCHYAAFSAGNLVTLAKALRSRYPFNPMLICGDSDLSGTGQREAQSAADAAGGKIALPVFTESEQQKGASDWLDRWQLDQGGAND